MTMAISKAVEHGAQAVICASTATRPRPRPRTRPTPASSRSCSCRTARIAMGKLSQAVAHDAEILQVLGNFDDCLDIARDLAENYPCTWSTR